LSRLALHIRIYRIQPRPRKMIDMRDSATPSGPGDLSRRPSWVMQMQTLTAMPLNSTKTPTGFPSGRIDATDPDRPPVAFNTVVGGPVTVSAAENPCSLEDQAHQLDDDLLRTSRYQPAGRPVTAVTCRTSSAACEPAPEGLRSVTQGSLKRRLARRSPALTPRRSHASTR
jgi:hypothetical protein